MCFNAWLLGGKIHRKLLISSNKYQLQEGNVLFSPPMPFSTQVVIFVGKAESWKQFFLHHTPQTHHPTGEKEKVEYLQYHKSRFPKSSKKSHSHSPAIAHFHTTGFRVKPSCNYWCGERESTLFTNLVSVLVKREGQRGEECNNKKAKQVPAGVEDFWGVAICENAAKSNTPVSHWKVILRVRTQQRIQDWSCTKKRHSARGGIFCSCLALLQNLFRPFGKLTNCVFLLHMNAGTKRPGRDFHGSLRINRKGGLSPFATIKFKFQSAPVAMSWTGLWSVL